LYEGVCMNMLNKFKGLFVKEEGQGMTEYALILGVLAIGVVAILVLFGPELQSIFQDVLDDLREVSGNTGAGS
ncbi:hypothetical protein, partial [Pseudomonas sp. 2995-1]|uniref:Flp family type IVb pilin n=1 Tax=Pseudomonas sp. 2995-1 TaxID=1712679 RepID=UPI001C473B1F